MDQATPKEIFVRDDVTDKFGYNTLAVIQANVLELVLKYGPDATISIDSEEYYGSTTSYVYITHKRMQTQAEADAEETRLQSHKLQRKQTFEALKKEFEGQ